MNKFTFVFQDGGQPVTSETKSQIRAHAMLGHLRQKFDTFSEVKDKAPSNEDFHPQNPAAGSDISFQIHDWNSQKQELVKREDSIEYRSSRGNSILGRVMRDPNADEQDNWLLPFGPADISSLIGSYPYDGVPPAVSQKISYAFQFRKTIFSFT
jgi:hypothetical protein